ncbi:hypothetical protein BDZ94DRAFT_925155 [Collybia nuda]|uniref:Uncharacterized protein n=1 Tax=Collybia nuda TaxID=64659 RepID=A0A9P5Y191_9AGAR|nr:hypothetical protein BDZ94DRAFT_925155 [Collybia nuda]
MSKPALDSDLYGDIYGDDDNEFAVPLNDTEDWDEPQAPKETRPANTQPVNPTISHSTTLVPQDALRSLPPKPQLSDSSSLSYSAQIAQQFSAYQQTPSQERQQRPEIPLPPNPRQAAGTSAIATHETSTPNTGTSDSIFGKKPSEMHDSG